MNRRQISWTGRRVRAGCAGVLAALVVSVPAVTQPRQGAAGVGVVTVPGQPPGTPPRDRSGRSVPPDTGTASISGRVTDATTGLALGRAVVAAHNSGRPGPLHRPPVTRTADDGTYVLRTLPPGTYVVSAQRTGYTERYYGQTGGTSQAPPRRITLDHDSRATGIDLVLQPTAVIAGRVFDEAGEPAVNVTMRALRVIPGRAHDRFVGEGAPVSTDDLGQFRLHGLPPGEYIVSAEPRPYPWYGRTPSRDQEGERLATVSTYAPATPSASDAQRVTVAPGQELTADVQLIEARVARVSGRVVDSTGAPLEGGTLSAFRQEASVTVVNRHSWGLAADGTFEIPDLQPGTYHLEAVASSRRRLAGAQDVDDMEAGSMTLVVEGEDIPDVVIATGPASTITGRLIVEGDASTIRLESLRIDARPRDAAYGRWRPGSGGEIDAQRAIRVTGLRGTQVLTLAGLPRGWWVKTVRINGQDALRGFDFGHGRTLSGLEIVINDRPASLGGTVTATDGTPASDYVVLVFAEHFDALSSTRPPGTYGMGRADHQGHFTVEFLRPGTYHAIAVSADAIGPAVFSEPDKLLELSQQARLITLAEGEQQYLSLPLSEP